MYQIMRQAEGRKFIPLPGQIYVTAEEAAKVAAKLTIEIGAKCQPRPIRSKVDWRDRERKRFESGEYKTLVWINEPWWKEIPNHFAHVSVKDKTKVAYTPDEEKGAADRQTSTSPGKYLSQFFGNVLRASEIRDFALQHSNEFEEMVLHFAKTPEEIQAAYKPYLGSCFSGTKQANLYGAGDFAVAYIKNDKDEITARTVCVPERKIWVRIYGDDARLGYLLRKAGYSQSDKAKDYDGLRLLKKHWWDGFYSDFYHCRYVDHPDDKKFMIVQAR